MRWTSCWRIVGRDSPRELTSFAQAQTAAGHRNDHAQTPEGDEMHRLRTPIRQAATGRPRRYCRSCGLDVAKAQRAIWTRIYAVKTQSNPKGCNVSNEARRTSEHLRQLGHDDMADQLDERTGISTQPPELGEAGAPPGVSADPRDAVRAANAARAQAETDAHFRGLSDEQIGEEMDRWLFGGGA
jgi:hypothetical protein